MADLKFISGKAALAQFIQGVQGEVSDKMDGSDTFRAFNASKRLKNSLSNEVTDQPGATRATLYALDYWKYVGNGRGPGKPPPSDRLIQWALDKGIATTDKQAKSIGIATAKKIGKEGTLDWKQGGKNVFGIAITNAAPKITGVLLAFAKDIPKPMVSEFKRTFAA